MATPCFPSVRVWIWLARKVIDESLLLVESDLVFPESLLVEMLPPDRIAISRRLPWMNGTTVTLGGGGGVSAFCLGAFSCADAAHFKTVNIYSLSRGTWRAVCERLDRRIVAGQTGDYYESVFAEMVADGSLALEPVFFPAERWYEIDTLADLEAAEKAGNGQEEGVQIALELIEKIKKFEGQGVNGLHIMAVGWEEIVPRIVTEAGVLPRGFVASPLTDEKTPA